MIATFCRIISFYSVKVFDGKLKKDIYDSAVFIVPPFDTGSDSDSVLSESHSTN